MLILSLIKISYSIRLQYKVNGVKFLGFVFNKEGMEIDKSRVNAILDLQVPTCKKELQRIFGTLKYNRNYIPNFSSLSSPLRELLKDKINWLWTENHSNCFNKIKEIVTSSPVLDHFNENKQPIIECDASQDAIGCCLMQEGRRVYYASRELTDTEKRFAQIEKELLSLVYACKKYHYLFMVKNFSKN